jgi:hypothetical protein
MTERKRLKEICNRRLSSRCLVVASNRGPTEHYFSEDGRLQSRYGSGGIATMLASLGNYVELH